MVPLEVARLITGEAPPGFHLLGSHSMGHLHLKDRIIGYGFLQIVVLLHCGCISLIPFIEFMNLEFGTTHQVQMC